jgi:hypothetical protein
VKTKTRILAGVVGLCALALAGCASSKEPQTIDVADRIAQARANYHNPAVSAGPTATGYSGSRKAYIK